MIEPNELKPGYYWVHRKDLDGKGVPRIAELTGDFPFLRLTLLSKGVEHWTCRDVIFIERVEEPKMKKGPTQKEIRGAIGYAKDNWGLIGYKEAIMIEAYLALKKKSDRYRKALKVIQYRTTDYDARKEARKALK